MGRRGPNDGPLAPSEGALFAPGFIARGPPPPSRSGLRSFRGRSQLGGRTGKSTTLDTCRLAWELAGHKVIGCALAGVAAEGLRCSSGIESDTLTRTLLRLEHGKIALTPNHVVVLDEAGMVATKPMAELVRHVEQAGAKLVLVGDAAQLQAIGAGGPFRSIAERVGQCELTQIRRQREPWRRQTVEHFSHGEAREALTAYAAREQLHVTETREERPSGASSAAGRPITGFLHIPPKRYIPGPAQSWSTVRRTSRQGTWPARSIEPPGFVLLNWLAHSQPAAWHSADVSLGLRGCSRSQSGIESCR
jgi:hypothetical protein